MGYSDYLLTFFENQAIYTPDDLIGFFGSVIPLKTTHDIFDGRPLVCQVDVTEDFAGNALSTIRFGLAFADSENMLTNSYVPFWTGGPGISNVWYYGDLPKGGRFYLPLLPPSPCGMLGSGVNGKTIGLWPTPAQSIYQAYMGFAVWKPAFGTHPFTAGKMSAGLVLATEAMMVGTVGTTATSYRPHQGVRGGGIHIS